MDNYNLWYGIFNLLDFNSQLAIISISKNFRSNLYITNLCDFYDKYSRKLNETLLRRDIFEFVSKIKIIALKKNPIWNISFLQNLKVLQAQSSSGITQNDIRNLDLTELDANNNSEINDVSFMKNLKVLRARG